LWETPAKRPANASTVLKDGPQTPLTIARNTPAVFQVLIIKQGLQMQRTTPYVWL
jgi:hypothetical protein